VNRLVCQHTELALVADSKRDSRRHRRV